MKNVKAKEIRSLAAIMILTIGVAACGMLNPNKEPRGPFEDYGAGAALITTEIPYATGVPGDDKLKLDVYSNPHEGLWPTVVMIHGGAWIMGDKEMRNKIYVSKVLAKNGYVVFNIDYRLAPRFKIDKQAEDVMGAVIWVKEHAREYGADPERVAVCGGSAGGHLAALVAWASDDPYFVPTGHANSKLDSDVLAAALYYPVIDLDLTLKQKTSIGAPVTRRWVTGKSGKKYREDLKHISPMNHIDATVPPTMILCGDDDGFKLYPQAVQYTDMLRKLGIDTFLFTAKGKDHGFTWNYWEPDSLASVMSMVKFFDKHVKNKEP